MSKILYSILLLSLAFTATYGQQTTPANTDSAKSYTFHYQLTAIDQGHPAFNAPYTGLNSLKPNKEQALSITTTLYLGTKLWKGASVYFNTEYQGEQV